MFALLIAAAASSATPTLEATARRMDANGVRATYTRTVEADGTIHLTGVYDQWRAPFHYRIKGDRVEGTADGIRMSFPRSTAR